MLLLPSFLGGFPDVEKFAVALLAGWKEGNPVGLAPFFKPPGFAFVSNNAASRLQVTFRPRFGC